MLVQELKTNVPLHPVHKLKSNTVFSECLRAHSPHCAIFMRSTGSAMQYWRITNLVLHFIHVNMVLHKPVVQRFLSPQYAVHWPVARLFWREPVDKTVIKHSSNKEEVELSVVCSMTSTDRRVDLVLSETFFWHVFVFRLGRHQLGTEVIWLYPSFALLLIKNHIKITQRNQIRHCHKSEKGSST